MCFRCVVKNTVKPVHMYLLDEETGEESASTRHVHGSESHAIFQSTDRFPGCLTLRAADSGSLAGWREWEAHTARSSAAFCSVLR